MTTAANLFVILTFLSALYTLLGVLCAVAERFLGLLQRAHRRRSQGTLKRRRVRPRRTKRMLPVIDALRRLWMHCSVVRHSAGDGVPVACRPG